MVRAGIDESLPALIPCGGRGPSSESRGVDARRAALLHVALTGERGGVALWCVPSWIG